MEPVAVEPTAVYVGKCVGGCVHEELANYYPVKPSAALKSRADACPNRPEVTRAGGKASSEIGEMSNFGVRRTLVGYDPVRNKTHHLWLLESYHRLSTHEDVDSG